MPYLPDHEHCGAAQNDAQFLESLRQSFLMEACRALKSTRCGGGITISELAVHAGVSPDVIERVEAGDLTACSFGEFVELVTACDQLVLELALVLAASSDQVSCEAGSGSRTAPGLESWNAAAR